MRSSQTLWISSRRNSLPDLDRGAAASQVATARLLLLANQLELLASLVNFGALFGFLMLHVAVIVSAIIAYVLINMATPAKIAGISWLIVGTGMVLVANRTRTAAST